MKHLPAGLCTRETRKTKRERRYSLALYKLTGGSGGGGQTQRKQKEWSANQIKK